MNPLEEYSSGDDISEEDIRTTKFLELLLRYNYASSRDCEETFKLNLSEDEKCQFLEDCSEIYQDIDELEASVNIINLRELYDEAMRNNSKNANGTKYPWISLADRLFRKVSELAIAEIPASQSSKHFRTPVRTSLPTHAERLIKSEEAVRSTSRRDALMKTDITSDYLPYIPRKSKSLPSTSQSPLSDVSLIIPTAAFCLCPPIVANDESMALKIYSRDSPDATADIASVSFADNDSPPAVMDLTTRVTRASTTPDTKASTPQRKNGSTSANIEASTPPGEECSTSSTTRGNTLPSTTLSNFPNRSTVISFPTPPATFDSISPIAGSSNSSDMVPLSLTTRISTSPTTKVFKSPSALSSPTSKSRLSTSPTTKDFISPSDFNKPRSRLSTSSGTSSCSSPATSISFLESPSSAAEDSASINRLSTSSGTSSCSSPATSISFLASTSSAAEDSDTINRRSSTSEVESHDSSVGSSTPDSIDSIIYFPPEIRSSSRTFDSSSNTTTLSTSSVAETSCGSAVSFSSETSLTRNFSIALATTDDASISSPVKILPQPKLKRILKFSNEDASAGKQYKST